MNVSVDVGSNITSLIERLAAQIGTTADKVFPWYVQQSYIEGMTGLIAGFVGLFLALLAIGVGFRKADFDNGNRYAVISIAGATLLFMVSLVGLMSGPDAVTKVMNPNYHAMKMMTRDIGKMVGK